MLEFPDLFRPLRLRSAVLPNRIIAAPQATPFTHKMLSTTNYGNVSLQDKSIGGAALLFVMGAPVGADGQYAKADRDVIREQISVLKQGGGLAGVEALVQPFGGSGPIYGPSAFERPDGQAAVEADPDALRELAAGYARSIVAAQEFGFDVAMLHFGHDQLPAQFLSPRFNRRTDEYGGSLENRMRFPVELVRAVRAAVGPDYPLLMRISAVQHVEGSYAFEDMLTFLGEIRGDIDLVNVSCGMDTWMEANVYHVTSIFEPNMFNVHWAERIKQAYPELAVCPVGAIMTPAQGQEIIASGKADAVMLGRPLIADPFWPKKARDGRADDIVPCIRCSYCYHVATEHADVECSVNPRYRRENRVPLEPPTAARAKRVVVIGAGPAGATAALTAAKKGHEVTLLEQLDEVGGQIRFSRYEHHKEDLLRFQQYLDYQLRHSRVDLQLGVTADRDLVASIGPDAIVVAVGAEPMSPPIPGLNLPHVHPVLDLYPHEDRIGQRVVIIGGGVIGSEFGLDLAETGREVAIVEQADRLNAGGHKLYRIAIRQHMDRHTNLSGLTSTTCLQVTMDAVQVREPSGNVRMLPADTVVVATGMRPRRTEAWSFLDITPETYLVGDCQRVRRVLEATNQSYFIAANI